MEAYNISSCSVLVEDAPRTPRFYYADVTVYGLPAPQVAYREKSGNSHRRVLTSNWMYWLRTAKRGDAGWIYQPPQQSPPDDVVMGDASRQNSPANRPRPSLECLSVPSDGRAMPPRSQQALRIHSTSPLRRSRSRSRSRFAEFHRVPSRSPSPQYRGRHRHRSCSSRRSPDRNVRRRRVPPSRSRSASRQRTRSPSPDHSFWSQSHSWSRSRSHSVSRTPTSPSREDEGALVVRTQSPPRSNNPNAMAIRSRGRPPLDRQRMRELFPDVPPPAFPVLLDVDNGGQSSILVVTNLPVYFLWIDVLEWLWSALPLVSCPRIDRVLRTLEDGHQVFWIKLRTITEAAALRGLLAGRRVADSPLLRVDFVDGNLYSARCTTYRDAWSPTYGMELENRPLVAARRSLVDRLAIVPLHHCPLHMPAITSQFPSLDSSSFLYLSIISVGSSRRK